MSWRSDGQLVAGKWVSSAYAGHGITGAAVRAMPVGLHGRGIFYNDWLSGDDAVEFRAVPRTWPAGLQLFEDGSLIYTGTGANCVVDLYADGVSYGPSTLALGSGSTAAVSRGIASTAAVGRPQGVRRAVGLAMARGVASTAAVGRPQGQRVQSQAAVARGIASTAAVGRPFGLRHAVPVGYGKGIPSTAAVGRPMASATLVPPIGPIGCYTSTQQLVDRFGLDEIIQITNPFNPQATTISPARVEAALLDIDALVDAKLSPRYTLPLPSIPRVLRNVATDLVRARLYDDRLPEHLATRQRDALKLLDDMASGKVSLGLTDRSQPTAPDQGPSWFDGTATFTADSLRDYAP